MHTDCSLPDPRRAVCWPRTIAQAAVCWLLATAASLWIGEAASAGPAPEDVYAVGVAKVDITPRYRVRLSGFAIRRAESEGVTERIWAKALAIGKRRPFVLVTVDNLGIPAAMEGELAARLVKDGVSRNRLAVMATHTHTAPMLTNACPTLFGEPIPAEHQKHIDRYTRELTDRLEKVARAALGDRRPARLSWGIGRVDFAVNRRTAGGPVDHDLPLLVVRDLKGKLRALYVSYACHCVTLSNNKISGDWAGYAQQALEDEHPRSIALVSVGCGGDSNPRSGVTGDRTDIAARQGRQIAAEVKRLLRGYLAPITGRLTFASGVVNLPLAKLPTRGEWQKRAARTDAVGYHARVQLERLARGQKLKDHIDYPVTTWAFGDSLAMVFLPGEVVVDYARRLKRELDGRRLWINAYANDAPGYIPSERVLKEGGYEGGGAMVYYDVPGPFRPGLENKIVTAVREQLIKDFAPTFDPRRTGGSLPLSPQQSLATLRPKPGLAVDLVAAEPLVASPVAIDFGPDGRLWVAEMIDYPAGAHGDYKPAGRIRVLEDTDGDGIFDKATVFLDKIPFPTGITVWRKGVLVCAAPDILYAEDTKGTGKADVVKKLYSGFGTDNYQARVNSLSYGLDGWVYGSCGLFGGKIKSHRTGKVLALGDRDFRIHPDTGAIEPATGRTQQGRVRDDWGNWFGCDNSNLCWHYVLADHYLRRNPYAAAAGTTTSVPDGPDPNRLYPIREQVQLFKLSGPPNRVTAACGIGIYRDDLLGAAFRGNVFTCEPVNLVVHRLVLSPRGSTFVGHRAADEAHAEFLAGTDNWFRPVQVRTGPDGALWIVDMYRYVIEHPRWIPGKDLARLDVRAGFAMGRIYRVRPAERPLRKVPRFDQLSTAELVQALDNPNGTQRDLAGQMLLWRGDVSAAPALEKLAAGSGRPEVRLHALCVLDSLGTLTPELVRKALHDPNPGVRRHAVRLVEKFLAGHKELGEELMPLIADGNAQVRLQTAYSLGAWRDPKSGQVLAALALRQGNDPHLLAAVLSSVNRDNIAELLAGVLAHPSLPDALVRQLLGMATAIGDRQTLARLLTRVTAPSGKRFAPWQMAALGGVLDALERRQQSVEALLDRKGRGRLGRMFATARATALDPKAPAADRLAAIAILGREPSRTAADRELLGRFLVPQNPIAIQSAALAALGRLRDEEVAGLLLKGWKTYTPSLHTQAIELLLSRPAWQGQLLAALEKKQIPAAHLDAARRQRLLLHPDARTRARAAKVFDGPTSADRRKVLRAYAGVVSLKGDAARGKAVFARRCAVCHRLEGVGHDVGPDLAALANKSPQYLLNEILDPNRNLDSRYMEFLALTKNGRSFTGLLAAETATSITMRGQEGKQQVLLRADLEELAATGRSLMPEGLEKDLTRQDLADLIIYLTNQEGPPKRFPGNRPETVRAVKGGYALLATRAAIHGDQIVFEQPFRNIGYWHGPGDYVVWTVAVDKAGTFDVWLDWACDNSVAGNAFVLEGENQPLQGKVAGTGGWDKYRRQKIGTVVLSPGNRRLTLRPDGGRVRGALFDLRGIHLVPVGQKPVFAAAGR